MHPVMFLHAGQLYGRDDPDTGQYWLLLL